MRRAQNISDWNLEQFIQNELRNTYPSSLVYQEIRMRRDLFWQDVGDFLRHGFSMQNMAISNQQTESEITTDMQIQTAIQLRLLSILRYEQFLRMVKVVRWERLNGKNKIGRKYRDETHALDRILRTAHADWDQLNPSTRTRLKRSYQKEKCHGEKWLLMAKKLSFGCIMLCGPRLAKIIDPVYWRGVTAQDVINHICEYYPEAIEIFQLLDPVVRSLLTHESVLPQINLGEVADRIDKYIGKSQAVS